MFRSRSRMMLLLASLLVCAVVTVNACDESVCSYHGMCAVKTNSTLATAFPVQCVCFKGYTTSGCVGQTECCYTQKPRVAAFLLAFFLGEVGAHLFYLGMTAQGVAVLLVFVFSLILGCFSVCLVGFGGDSAQLVGLIMAVLYKMMIAGCAVFWFVSWVLIAVSAEPWTDSNGQSIAPW